MLFLSSATPILSCGHCGGKPHPKPKPKPKSPSKEVPPVTVPKLPLPPVTVPTVPLPKLPVPPTGGSKSPPAACPPPPAKKETCPIDVLKLGACVDLLGGIVHIGLGDPVVNKCCPVLAGLVEVEAAVCLCTTLKIKALNLNIYVPLALELLITCGKSPPPGYTCSL
ncbi:unnamed protein product [Linum tenue]|uniref:Bifunctional inhibitor/plant lipid transfer protein/seed storage helical domain-containing protein n=1 Tax=Linum tenue TaxID=586396 RepID=A0AAV0HX78_9ROSI|nr:unnamed protein product [Linum tenue]